MSIIMCGCRGQSWIGKLYCSTDMVVLGAGGATGTPCNGIYMYSEASARLGASDTPKKYNLDFTS